MRMDRVCEAFFTLKRPERFTNTTRVFGSRPSLTGSGEYGLALFSGYVFRGDSRPPNIIFETGFAPRACMHSTGEAFDQRLRRHTGSRTGMTGRAGVSTTICAHVAQQYLIRVRGGHAFGYVYLIDARYLSGYAIRSPRPNVYPTTSFPILKMIYEVNFTHQIPTTYIAGVVWSKEYLFHGEWYGDPYYDVSSAWPPAVRKLTLGSNPAFGDGVAGIRELVKRFNC